MDIDYAKLDRDRAFGLVQRARVFDRGGKPGVDALFDFAYMGSSEYECGELGRSLRRLRAAGDVAVRRTTVEDHSVWVVGSAAQVEEKTADLHLWIADGARSLDGNGFLGVLRGEPTSSHLRVDLWWALNADIAWALDEQVAQRLITGITGVKAES